MPPQFRSLFLLGALLAVFLLSRTAFLLWGPWCLVTLVFLGSGILRRVSESHKQLFECLDNHLLPSHHAFVLLRSAVLPRLSYLSRVVPPEILLPAAEWFDSSVRGTFSKRLRDPALSADVSLRKGVHVRCFS